MNLDNLDKYEDCLKVWKTWAFNFHFLGSLLSLSPKGSSLFIGNLIIFLNKIMNRVQAGTEPESWELCGLLSHSGRVRFQNVGILCKQTLCFSSKLACSWRGTLSCHTSYSPVNEKFSSHACCPVLWQII